MSVGSQLSFTASSDPSIIKTTWTAPSGSDVGYNVQVIPSGSASSTYLRVFALSAFITVNSNLVPIFRGYADISRSAKMIKYFYARQAQTVTITYK